MMRIDPNKPGLIELWQMFLSGDRSPMALIAVVGSCVLMVLLVVGLMQL